jgi:Mor family transcriptional regulator
MSEFMIRALAAACAPRIAAKVEAAVVATVRAELAGTIEAVLREQWAGEHLRIYVPKRPRSFLRDRNEALRAKFNGTNGRELAAEFSMSIKQVLRICRPPR